MKKARFYLWLLPVLLLFSGCAVDTGVVPMGNGTYMVSCQAATGFHGMIGLKAKALKIANTYCDSQDRCLYVIRSIDAPPPYILGNFPKTELQFMCLEPNDPRLQGNGSEKINPPVLSSAVNPAHGNETYIQEVLAGGEVIKLANGCIFEVDVIDRIDSMLWLPMDEVFMRTDSLINLTQGQKVQAIQLR